MSGYAQPWVPGFDSASGTLVLPLWSAAIVAATVAAFCVFVLARAERDGILETATRAGLLLSGAALAWIVLDTTSAGTLSAERRALDARWLEMTTRAAAPGSALSCLDATAGDVVETACEKALFASPEAAAASVAYVTAQLSLLVDGSDYERRTGASFEAVLGGLRHAIEADRFGIVAHVLADRDGCTPDRCDAFSLLSDTSSVRENMSGQKYHSIVMHYAPDWPRSVASPVAVNSESPPAASPPAVGQAAAAPAPSSAAAVAPKSAASGLYFPSSASIPPVSIMSAEPTGPPSQAGPTEGAPKPAATRAKPTASTQPARRPGGTAPSGQNGDQ
ncbi:MAG TPA: hypothetical protein VKW08_06240 [Xanthobacteraceae bacterium]|nr:hypothetical protein [Xanthobacteraceae bacterium]